MDMESKSRYRTGTSLTLKLMWEVFSNADGIDLILNGIPQHEPQWQASSSPIPKYEYGLLGERERRITYLYQYKHQMKTKGRRDHQREPIVPVASTIFLKHSTETLTRQKKHLFVSIVQ